MPSLSVSPRVHTQCFEVTFLSSLSSPWSPWHFADLRGHPFLVFWVERRGFTFPALSYNLLRLTLPQGLSSEKKRTKTNGDSIRLGTTVSLVRNKGSPPLGLRVPIQPRLLLHRAVLPGGWGGKNQSGESAQDRKQGISSTFCLVGGPFLAPQTRNRGLLFELPFHVCSVLLGFRLKDTIYNSSKKYEVPWNRPNKTSTKYL